MVGAIVWRVEIVVATNHNPDVKKDHMANLHK
jgi:hypothetical protein